MLHEYFDIRTLSLVNGIVAIALFGCMLFVSTNQKVYPGFSRWTVASLLHGTGFIILSMRDLLPDLLTIVIANLLIIGFFVLNTRGLVDFAEIEQDNLLKILDFSPLVVVGATFLYFTYHVPHVNLRIMIIALLAVLLCWRCAFIVYKHVPLVLSRTNRFLLITFIFMGVWFLSRAILTVTFEIHITSFMSASVFQSLSSVVGIVGNIMIVTGFIIINAQRLEFDLIQAKSDVQSLTGLLPICSSCKKIRDDSGYWHDVAVYVRNHSEADFTHGICPECKDKLYPFLKGGNG